MVTPNYVRSNLGKEITPTDIHPADLEALETYEVRFPFGGPNHGKKFTEISQYDLRRYSQRKNKWGRIAQKELERRGTPPSEQAVEPSLHAIDRASTICLDLFVSRPDKSVGIRTWLSGIAADAITWGNKDNAGRYAHMGLKFIFDFSPPIPVLVTILDNRNPGVRREVIAPPNS